MGKAQAALEAAHEAWGLTQDALKHGAPDRDAAVRLGHADQALAASKQAAQAAAQASAQTAAQAVAKEATQTAAQAVMAAADAVARAEKATSAGGNC